VCLQNRPDLVRVGSFSLDGLLSHIDLIYEQRHTDLSSERNSKGRR
jgi:hypothetical protein